MEMLRALKDQLSDLTLILLTAQGTVETAVEAIKEGAYDYLSKPVDPQRLQILLQKAVERLDTLREVRHLRRQLREAGKFGRIIGNSPTIDRSQGHRKRPRRVRRADLGRVRTGKSDSRRRLTSSARRRPVVAINSRAIRNLLKAIFSATRGRSRRHDRRGARFERSIAATCSRQIARSVADPGQAAARCRSGPSAGWAAGRSKRDVG